MLNALTKLKSCPFTVYIFLNTSFISICQFVQLLFLNTYFLMPYRTTSNIFQICWKKKRAIMIIITDKHKHILQNTSYLLIIFNQTHSMHKLIMQYTNTFYAYHKLSPRNSYTTLAIYSKTHMHLMHNPNYPFPVN